METPFNNMPVELLPTSYSSMNEFQKEEDKVLNIFPLSQLLGDSAQVNSSNQPNSEIRNTRNSVSGPKFSIRNHLRHHKKSNNQNLT